MTHQLPMPDVPKPDALPSEAEIRDRLLPRMPDPVRRYYERERPIELRPVEYGRYLGEKLEGGRFHLWIRANGPPSRRAGDPSMRAGLCVGHGFARRGADPARQDRVSTKTSWRRAWIIPYGFTGPFRADEWLLYVQDSPNIGGARGFSRGSVFASDGTLVASVAQEGLLRQRRPKPD